MVGIVAVLVLAATAIMQAATFYWDANGTGGGTGGTGDWTGGSTWRDGSDTGTLGSWVDNNDALFAGTAGTVTVNSNVTANNVTLNTDKYTLSGSNVISLGGTTPSVNVSTGSSLISAPIGGSVGLTKTGSGTLHSAANNTYTGPTTISAGTFKLQPASPVPGSLLWLDGADVSTITKDGSNNVSAWASKSGSYTVTPPGTQPVYTAGGLNGNGVISFSDDSLTNIGLLTESNFSAHQATEFVVYTANDNHYTVVNTTPYGHQYWRYSGTGNGYFAEFRLSTRFSEQPANMPSNGSAMITVRSGTGTDTYQVWKDASLEITGDPQWGISPTLTIGSGSAGGPLNGDIAEVLIYNTALSEPDRQNVESYLTAKWFGAGPGPFNHIPDASPVTVAGGATLDLAGASETVGSLAGAGDVKLGHGTLTTGGDNTSTAFSGVISGSGGLVKQGTGTLVLANINTYGGPTTISAGTLKLPPSSPVPGSLLWLDAADESTITKDGSNNVSAWDSKSGSYTVTPPGTQPVYTTGGLNGNSVISFNNSKMTNTGLLTSANFPTEEATEFVVYTARNGTYNVVNTTPYTHQYWRYAGDGNGYLAEFRASSRFRQLPKNMPSNGSTLITIRSGTGDDTYQAWKDCVLAGSLDPQWGITSELTLGATVTDSRPLTGDIAEVLIYNTALSEADRQHVEAYLAAKWFGAGVGSFNYIPDGSAVTIAGGAALDLNGHNETIGSLAGGGNVALGSGTLTTGGNNGSTAFSGVISGSGGLTKEGAGTFTLSGASSFTGPTTVNNGTFQLSSGDNRLNTTTDVTVNGPGVFDLNGQKQTIDQLSGNGGVTLGSGKLTVGNSGGSSTFGGTISGANGQLSKIGGGTLTLTGTNSHTGRTMVRDGTLQIGNGGTTGSVGGGISVGNGTALVFNRSDNLTHSGDITGAGSLEKKGTGTLTLQGDNTHTGGTTVTAGTLQGNTANLQGNITNNGSLVLDQNTDGTYIGAIGGSGSLTKSGAGTLTLAASNSYAGPTTINAGTIRLQSAAFAPTAGSLLWLDAADESTITKAGNNVSAWASKSGSYTVTSPGTQPQYVAGGLNGNGVISFNDSVMTNAGLLTNTNFSAHESTEFVVYTTRADGYNVLNTAPNNAQWWRYHNDDCGYMGEFRSGRLQFWPSTGIMPASGGSALMTLQSGTGAGTYQMWKNGSLVATYNPSWAISPTLTIGGGNNGGGPLNGDIAEVLIYNTALSAADRQAVENYLMAKWFGVGLGPFDAIPDGSAVTIAGGAAFELAGVNETIGSLAGGGNVALGSGTLTTGGNNGSTAFSGVISGSGGLTKEGTGTFTLSGPSSFTGSTTVNAGTLLVTGSLANNGSDKILIAADPDGNFATAGPTLTRNTPSSSSYAGLGSSVTTGLQSAADLLAGTNSTGSDDSVSMQWRLREPSEQTGPATGIGLISEVLNLTGMVNGGSASGRTDVFVLQMQYDETLLPGYEPLMATEGWIYPAWLDPVGGEWENAILGNFGSNTGLTNVQGSWAIAGGSTMTLGSWGVDIGANVVWAVLDHNSDFSVFQNVPEPSCLALLTLGILGLLARRRWKRGRN